MSASSSQSSVKSWSLPWGSDSGPSSDATAGWDVALHRVTTSLDALARDSVDAMSSLWCSITGQPQSKGLFQRTQDQIDQKLASWRWGGHPMYSSQRVPLPSEADERTLLAAVSFAKAVHDQVVAQGGVARAILHCPVTTLVTGATVAVFMYPGGLPLRDVCLSPFCVVQRGEVHRLLTSAVVHLDAAHLLSNLSSAIPNAMVCEDSSGSEVFAAEVVGLTAASHALYVLWAWGQKQMLGRKDEYYSVGAAGLSSVAFALQVVASERQGNVTALPLGVRFPARYAWVVQLALTHLCAPDASFPGHLCGVGAGLVYVYILQPLLCAVGVRPRGWGGRWDTPSRPTTRFYGAGTTSGRVVSSGAPAGRRAWWQRWAAQLGSQLALVALAAGVYVLGARRAPGRRPVNSWQW